MKYRLTLLVEEQQEGGYTITCRELPELITECDSLDDMIPTVKDAFAAVVELYEYRGHSLPPDILLTDTAVKEDGVAFSLLGRELFRIINQEPEEDYTKDLQKYLERQNVQMTEIPIQ